MMAIIDRNNSGFLPSYRYQSSSQQVRMPSSPSKPLIYAQHISLFLYSLCQFRYPCHDIITQFTPYILATDNMKGEAISQIAMACYQLGHYSDAIISHLIHLAFQPRIFRTFNTEGLTWFLHAIARVYKSHPSPSFALTSDQCEMIISFVTRNIKFAPSKYIIHILHNTSVFHPLSHPVFSTFMQWIRYMPEKQFALFGHSPYVILASLCSRPPHPTPHAIPILDRLSYTLQTKSYIISTMSISQLQSLLTIYRTLPTSSSSFSVIDRLERALVIARSFPSHDKMTVTSACWS